MVFTSATWKIILNLSSDVSGNVSDVSEFSRIVSRLPSGAYSIISVGLGFKVNPTHDNIDGCLIFNRTFNSFRRFLYGKTDPSRLELNLGSNDHGKARLCQHSIVWILNST